MRIGLVGAGDWAQKTHLPALLGHGAAQISGIWARRAGAAARVAEPVGVHAFDGVDALLSCSDAVAVAVTPQAQPDLAIRAAQAGCHLILEKPVGDSAHAGARVAEAIAAAGVHAVVFATREWDPARSDAMSRLVGVGGHLRYTWRSRGMLGGGGTWRQQAGALIDVGPHMLPLLERICGPIEGIQIAEFPAPEVVHARFEHAGGSISEIDIDMAVDVPFTRESLELDGVPVWSNDASVDFLAAYRQMLDALERLAAGRDTEADRSRGAVAAQLRASAIIDELERLRPSRA